MTPLYDHAGVSIYHGDALGVLRDLPGGSIDCCVTSPPYWGLRDYGVEGQIGLESTPQEYTAKIVEVFEEVRRVLTDDGTLWLNLGDSYNNTDKWSGGQNAGKHVVAKDGGVPSHAVSRKRPPLSGLKPKDLCGIPWRVAFALQDAGWWLRSDIIWAKSNPMPESVTDRPTRSHEYIFLLSKSANYFYDAAAIAEKAICTDVKKFVDAGKDKQRGHGRRHAGFNGRYADKLAAEGAPTTRNKRDVWNVNTEPFPDAHFAVFPPALILPCVLAGCPDGGIVLDPFGGSGTTAMVAKENGRQAISIELRREYIEIQKRRVGQDNMFSGVGAMEALA